MKKKLAIVLSLVLVFATLFMTACGDGATTTIKVGTGGPTGTYFAFCNVIATTLNEKSDLQLMVQSSGSCSVPGQGQLRRMVRSLNRSIPLYLFLPR